MFLGASCFGSGFSRKVDSGTLCIGVTSSFLQEDTYDLVKLKCRQG